MADVEIIHPAPDGNGTSILINGIEINRSVTSYEVSAIGGRPPLVQLDLHVAQEQRLCMKDANVSIDDSAAEMLESIGWKRPAASA